MKATENEQKKKKEQKKNGIHEYRSNDMTTEQNTHNIKRHRESRSKHCAS